MERNTLLGLEQMEHVAAARAAGYVVAPYDAWDPAAPVVERFVAQQYWQWCAAHHCPFVLIRDQGAPGVTVVLDVAPLGPGPLAVDEAAVDALLRLAGAPGLMATGHGYRPEAGGRYWRVRAVPAGLAVAVAQELLCLAASDFGFWIGVPVREQSKIQNPKSAVPLPIDQIAHLAAVVDAANGQAAAGRVGEGYLPLSNGRLRAELQAATGAADSELARRWSQACADYFRTYGLPLPGAPSNFNP